MNQRHISRRQFLRAGSWAVAGAVVVDVAPRIFLPARDFSTGTMSYRASYLTGPYTWYLQDYPTNSLAWWRTAERFGATSHDPATVMRFTALALRGRAV